VSPFSPGDAVLHPQCKSHISNCYTKPNL
jgi:hypothetical protein